MPREKADAEKSILVQSMVGAQTGLPAVMFRLGDQFVNLPPDQAREIALQLMHAGYAAELDAALVKSLRSHGMEDRAIAVLLESLRSARPGGQ